MSAKRDTHMESDIIEYVLAGPPYRDNLFCASDAPYGRQTWNFGGFRAMLVSLTCGSEHTDPRVEENSDAFDSEMVDDMLGGNLATFLIETYERFLGI
jgi:hypothetical protein